MHKNHQRFTFFSSILLLSMLCGAASAADWTLDNEASQLNFVSIKAGNIAETHTFDELMGHISESGAAELSITLDSVNTAIDIRNERMRTMLFDTASAPKATIKTSIDATMLNGLEPGQSMLTTVEAMLDLSGTQSTITAELQVFKLNASTLLVSTHKPILLNATNLGLEAGVEKLREVAGLPAISLAVPVSFTLLFTAS